MSEPTLIVLTTAAYEILSRRIEALEKELKSLRGIVFMSMKKKKT